MDNAYGNGASLSGILTVCVALSVMLGPAHAACDISGFWSLEAENIPLPRNPFVKFTPSGDGKHQMELNACLPFYGTATAQRGWIIGEIEIQPPPPLNEIKVIWEMSDDCQWASGWIYALQPASYGNQPIKSSLHKISDRFEADIPENKRKNRKCPDERVPNLSPDH